MGRKKYLFSAHKRCLVSRKKKIRIKEKDCRFSRFQVMGGREERGRCPPLLTYTGEEEARKEV